MKSSIGAVLVLGVLQAACSADGATVATAESDSLVSDPASLATARSELTAIGQDCSAFDGYTAALATATVDCLGTIRPDSFRVDEQGFLRRSFNACSVDATRLGKIDSLLSLQQREARLPKIKQCFAGHYADFVRSFADSGVRECPTWQKDREVNPIDARVVDNVSRLLSRENELETSVIKKAFQGSELDALELKNLYRVSFSEPAARSENASTWAAQCAGGFQGFVLEAQGPSALLTDPPAWLLDTTYLSAAEDPYLRDGYYHPMCYYGGAPGVAFGEPERYRPCPTCRPESCCYYAGLALKTQLQLDCLDPNDWDTCVSYCGPPLH